ncbi:TIGR01244 family sulfur transferase [Sphingosinicella microcystinivorans]|uniref:TIGR01244 family sulfur transferase n=1 Tax=Sphingosinicella microcystinivorans TaxID=335406 RepID=UPI0022F38F7A|nr:TIGR01244 family sulfur transferase [Sphingosinicella microcystinivorans]WBX85427.1 TIGR01244 family sulfur transferase [Sphingosinicella microcystinivorans]
MSPQLVEIAPSFTVCGQLLPDHLPGIAAQGFTLVINNRPDGEEEGQPGSASVGQALAVHGIDYIHIPVVAGKWTEPSVDAFREALGRAGGGKVLAFCRSGMRAAAMWVLAAEPEDRADAIEAVSRAKIDLSKMSGLGFV